MLLSCLKFVTFLINLDISKNVAKEKKTYNSGYSLVVTYLTTDLPVRCLNRAVRTGSLVVSELRTTNIPKFSVNYLQDRSDLKNGPVLSPILSKTKCLAAHKRTP